MVPSVLIVSEELTFLLNCYTSLHRDARIGQIEATTSGEEAGRLVQTLRPDAVVIDTSAGDGMALAVVRRLRDISPDATMVVTFRERESDSVDRLVRTSGAAGVLSREALSAEALLRLIRDNAPGDGASIASPA